MSAPPAITRASRFPGPPTEIRSRWTDKTLYLLYTCPYDELNLKPDPNPAAETPRLWNWEVAEAFIGTDFDHIAHYKELQVSPQSEWVDLDINREDSKAAGGMALELRIQSEGTDRPRAPHLVRRDGDPHERARRDGAAKDGHGNAGRACTASRAQRPTRNTTPGSPPGKPPSTCRRRLAVCGWWNSSYPAN